MDMNNATVEVEGVISRETDKAVYVAMIWAAGGGLSGGCVWLPKSQLSGLTRGKTFINHIPGGRSERRCEFAACIPEWLAYKVMPPKTGPVPTATKPW